MTPFTTRPALEFSLTELADVFTRSFANYFVPVQMTAAALADMFRRDGADLAASRVLFAGEKVAGLAVVARRGWTSRLAAMGIVEGLRGQGAGTFLSTQLVREARERGDQAMVLEVIEQNERAVRLYQRLGFQKVRRLVGFSFAGPAAAAAEALVEVDIREVALRVARHGPPDLPWQLSGESVATCNPPARAYELNGAFAVLTDPTREPVALRALGAELQPGRHDRASRLLTALAARHPGRTWRMPPIWPEELAAWFEGAGFSRDALSQWQMRLSWEGDVPAATAACGN